MGKIALPWTVDESPHAVDATPHTIASEIALAVSRQEDITVPNRQLVGIEGLVLVEFR